MSEIDTTLNDVFKSTVLGDMQSPIGTSLYGFNHRKTQLPVPVNKDDHGYVFFTRPQLNMTDGNLRAERRFVPLLDQNPLSVPRYIRRTLDPRLSPNQYPCPLVDMHQAFIPLLTNMTQSISGWPDPSLDTYVSKPGVRREVFGRIDSAIEENGTYDLQLTLRNMQGDIATSLIDHWMWYSSLTFTGELVPYADFIAYNEFDHNTRVWRLVMDQTRRYVQKIASAPAAEFLSNPYGNAFNYETDRPLNAVNDTISLRIKCYGFNYQDPILVHEFNETTAIFNPDLRDLLNITGAAGTYVPMKSRTARSHVLLEHHEVNMPQFNGKGYPIIDPDTNELLWYVSRQDYQSVVANYQRVSQALGI